MLNINDIYKNESEYLKAAEIPAGKKIPVTIKGVGTVTFNKDTPKQQIKLAMSFQETEKKLTVNKTNGMVIAHVLGDDAEKWIGSKIFLYSTLVPFGDDMVNAIRVEMPLEEATLNQTFTPPQVPVSKQQPTQVPSNFDNFDDDIPF